MPCGRCCGSCAVFHSVVPCCFIPNSLLPLPSLLLFPLLFPLPFPLLVHFRPLATPWRAWRTLCRLTCCRACLVAKQVRANSTRPAVVVPPTATPYCCCCAAGAASTVHERTTDIDVTEQPEVFTAVMEVLVAMATHTATEAVAQHKVALEDQGGAALPFVPSDDPLQPNASWGTEAFRPPPLLCTDSPFPLTNWDRAGMLSESFYVLLVKCPNLHKVGMQRG